MEKITHERLKELLRYDPETGHFYWRVNRGGNARIGARAGSLMKGGKKGRRSVPYWKIHISGRGYSASRIAYFYMTKRWPDHQMDHKDRNSLNDAWENLRPATQSQNEANKVAYRNSSTGLKGIWPIKGGRYAARLYRNHKSNWLGVFDTQERASAAYAAAARSHDGEYVRLS